MNFDFSLVESQGYFVSTDKALLDHTFIHNFLSKKSYWARNIPLPVLQKSIEHSLCFGVYSKDRKQVGFARLITDFASFGYLADVFIDEGHQGKSLSKYLMSKIMLHTGIPDLRRLALFTRDAHKLYERFGFGPGKTPDNYMEIKKENPYSEL